MKYLACLLLIINLFFGKVAANADNNDKELGDNIWDKQQPASEDTEGCGKDMRKFGPNDQYRCNCKELAFCDFKNNGKCRNAKCKFGYRQQFCQKILYHEYLSRRISQQQNVFTDDTKEINNALNITFKYLYRIHLIEINCQSSVSAATISLYIGSTKFCEKKCQELTKCQGDAIGKYLLIKTTSKISLSNMKVSGCSRFWFGEKCDKQCHCASNSECHKWTGKCPMGCESGRSGSDCQTLNYVNVALNKTASQSSTYKRSSILINNTCQDEDFDFSANLAVDGNTDQQFQRRSCMHTNRKGYQYWEVDLGKKYNILQMRIYNKNTQVQRLDGTRITVDDQLCYVIRRATQIIDIKCRNSIHGRTIKIQKGNRDVLHICEVEVLQCLSGFYGNRCNNSCPECKNSSCDQWNGHCRLGCGPGYGYQQHPSKTCTACPVGTFGEGCSQTCHCKNNNNCNKENGTCGAEGCEAGYKGHNCQDPCAIGTFGEGCSKTCHCINNSNCNKKNGTCGAEGCAAGYKGHTCQESCPIGTFDVGCSQTCYCKNNKNCNKENGICGDEGCGAGYKGHNCQENCLVGTFGEGCSQKCHCKDNNNCNKNNGNCGPEGCKLGYKGHNCQQSCAIGTFGKGCSQTCHCININNCNKENGFCVPEGCEANYKGHNCQQFNFLVIIPVAVYVFLLLFIISAGCVIYFKSKRTKESKSLRVSNISPQDEMETVPAAAERNMEVLARNMEVLARNDSNFARTENTDENITENTNANFSSDNDENMENIYDDILDENIPTYIEINDLSVADSAQVKDGEYMNMKEMVSQSKM